MASVTVTLSLDERRLLLALIEYAANVHAEAWSEQNWDWLDDLFASSWQVLESARRQLAKGTQ